MPRSLGNELPGPLSELWDGSDLEGRVGHTFLCLTVDAEGWPHVAMLSVGEVLAAGSREVSLALWPGSATTANLERTGLATLMAVVPPASWYVRLRARRDGEISVQGRPRAVYRCGVEEVLEDVVSYATVTHGIEFQLPDPPAVIGAWRAAIEGLRDTVAEGPEQ